MVGIVTSSDVLKNFRTIWHEFGPEVALGCIGALFRRKPVTFLEVAFGHARR